MKVSTFRRESSAYASDDGAHLLQSEKATSIEPAGDLRDVPLQMLLAPPMIRAMVNALQYRPIALDPVGVAVVSDILASGMADSLLMRRHGVDRRVKQEASLSAQQGK